MIKEVGDKEKFMFKKLKCSICALEIENNVVSLIDVESNGIYHERYFDIKMSSMEIRLRNKKEEIFCLNRDYLVEKK